MRKIFIKILNSHKGEDFVGGKIKHCYKGYKLSPLHDLQEELQANFIVFSDALWVDRYQDLEVEYQRLHEDVAMTDISSLTMISIKGSKLMEKFAPYLTADPKHKDLSNHLIYSGFTADNQLLFDDGIIFVVDENHWMITLNVSFASIEAFIHTHIGKTILVDDISEEIVKLQVQGPNALDAIREVFPQAQDLKPFDFASTKGDIVSRCGYSRVGGFEVYTSVERGRELWLKLIAEGVTPYGISTMDISRIEARLICFGHEFGCCTHKSHQVGLNKYAPAENDESQIKFFVFKDAPENMKVRPIIGDVITDEQGRHCGEITSCAFSPLYKKFIGFAEIDGHNASANDGLFVHQYGIQIK